MSDREEHIQMINDCEERDAAVLCNALDAAARTTIHGAEGMNITNQEREVIMALIEVARAADIALDNTEEAESPDGRALMLSSQDFDDIGDAIVPLEELPNYKPGFDLGPAARAEWALRRLLSKESSDDLNDASDLAVLRAFVADLLDGWPDDFCDIDGFDMQDACIKHGLFKQEKCIAPCGIVCSCAEHEGPGEVDCCVKQPALLRALDAAHAGEKP